MCVSSEFCEKNLQLLFSLLSPPKGNSENDCAGSHRLRANIIIAVGDLAFRFPNLLEPWTKYIYRPLSVRSHSLRVSGVIEDQFTFPAPLSLYRTSL
jgi:condensin complex subunit 1